MPTYFFLQAQLVGEELVFTRTIPLSTAATFPQFAAFILFQLSHSLVE
jgi:hypothetical protein